MTRPVPQHIVTNDYWYQKIKSFPLFETINEKGRVFNNYSVVVDPNSLQYFYKITGGNEEARLIIFQCVFSILLQKYFPDTTPVITFFSTAENPEDQQLLFFKTTIAEMDSVKQIIETGRNEYLEVMSNVGYDYDRLTAALYKDNIDINNYLRYGLSYNRLYASHLSGCEWQLFIKDSTNGNGLELELKIDTCRPEAQLGEQFLVHFQYLINNLFSFVDVPFYRLDLLSEEEKKRMLFACNDTIRAGFVVPTIVECFRNIVHTYAENTALLFDQQQYNYAQLNRAANRMANYLIDFCDVTRDSIIGILMPKTPEAIIAIIGVLKAGAAYMPIDIDYPAERINYMLHDSKVSVLITMESYIPDGMQLDDQIIVIEPQVVVATELSEREPVVDVDPHHLAYLIYTSGSTGQPKGVMIEHGSFVNMCLDQIKKFEVCPDDKVLLFASLSFDASVSEIFMALNCGATLVIPTADIVKNQHNILSYMKEVGVTVVTLPPSYLAKLHTPDVVFLKSIITAGEPANVLQAATIAAFTNYFNAYGPTECSVCTTIYKVKPEDRVRTSIPIGKPISNLKVYILDELLRLVPIGMRGEIFVSGAGLARGYLNKTDLTAERFIDNPFCQDEKMYKTGDIGRWLEGGDIEYLGRADSQLKLRGFRIEPGEIEWHLVNFSTDIKHVIVDVKNINGEKLLVAYFTADQRIEVAALRSYLQNVLPAYMLPAFYTQIISFPVTPNGKIDRQALSTNITELVQRKEYAPPRNETEVIIGRIWEDLLHINKIGIYDNFFELGGHSLIIGQAINRLHQQLGQSVSFREFFTHPTIAGIGSLLKSSGYINIPVAPQQESYPVTASQQRLWMLSQLADAAIAYNMPGVVRCTGVIIFNKLQDAFRYVIGRHEILRTRFDVDKEGIVRQFIRPTDQVFFEIRFHDFSHHKEKQQFVDNYLIELNNQPFDLSKDLLIRAYLIQLQKDEFLFFLTMPHIIGDGWSVEILITEVMEVYNTLILEKEVELPALRLQYKDYSMWLASAAYTTWVKSAEGFWLQQFEGNIPVLDLPAFRKRPVLQTYNGDSRVFNFPETFLAKLQTFSQAQGATLFMVLMTGIRALLSRYTNQQDIILGTPVAGREHAELEGQIGLYLNTLPIRGKVEKGASFQQLLQNEKQLLLNAFDHQQYPFGELVEKIYLKRDISRSALFDVLVVLQSQDQLKNRPKAAGLNGVQIDDYAFNRRTSQFDISFIFKERNGLQLNIEYNTDIYDGILIERMADHLQNFLLLAIQQPELTVEELDYITASEKVEINDSFNNTKVAVPQEQTIVDLFDARVAASPSNISVVFEHTVLDYRQLNELANQFARYINDIQKVKKGSFIGIKVTRSEYLLVILLGILKSGNAYVMIDPSFPPERIAYITSDAGCACCVTDQVLNEFKEVAQQLSKQDLELKPLMDDVVYLMYTSGSTGNPKGAVNTYRGFTNTVRWYAEDLGIQEEDRVGIISNVSFDLTQKNFFAPLIRGAAIYIDREYDPSSTGRFISEYKITQVNCAPILFYGLVDNCLSSLGSLTKVVLGGEGIKVSRLTSFLEKNSKAIIYNSYGPSEASDVSSYYKLTGKEINVPVGKPIRNTQLWILNDQLKACPIGVIGEICVGGIGVGLGYLNNESLTRDKFIDHADFGRIYKTGDLGRWFADGNIEFLGRKDFQVKIRGQRVELEEVEIAMAGCSNLIKQVVVDTRTFNDEKVLAAFYQTVVEIDKLELRQQLSSKLPAYMVPDFFLRMDAFPLTPSGKIDRKQLPPITANELVRRAYLEPANSKEEKLLSIWESVLGVDKISMLDDFFEIGGSSLKIMAVINLIKAETGVLLQFRDFFLYPTPALLGAYIESKSVDAHEIIQPLAYMPYYDITPTQFGIWYECQRGEEASLVYNMVNAGMMDGVLDIALTSQSLQLLLQKFEALRTVFTMEEVGIVQRILPSIALDDILRVAHISAAPNEIPGVIHTVLKEERHHLFNLETGPLLSIRYLIINHEKSLLILNVHHIVCDGISLNNLVKELFAIYKQLQRNGVATITPAPIQFKEYAHWINEQIALNAVNFRDYWRRQLLPLPGTMFPHAQPVESNNTVSTFTTRLDAQLATHIANIVRKKNITEYILYASALAIALKEATLQEEIIFISPQAIRPHTLFEGQVGLFLNSVPLKIKVSSHSFDEVLIAVKDTVLSNWDNSIYPFVYIIDMLKEEGADIPDGLFNVMMTLQNQGFNKADFPFHFEEADDQDQERPAMMDLLFNIIPDESGVTINATYKLSILSKEQLQRIMSRFVEVINIYM